MQKINVLWIGHPDYLNENSEAIRRHIAASLSPDCFYTPESAPVIVTDAQAIAAGRESLNGSFSGAVLILLTWTECSLVTTVLKELRGLPCILWGFPLEEVNGVTESTGSYVSAAMLSGPLKRLQLPIDVLIGSWKEKAIQQKLQAFARAAHACHTLFYSRIGLFGYTSMSIYPGTFDHVLMRWKLGPEVEQMDSYSLIRRAETVSEADIDSAWDKLQNRAAIRRDFKSEVLRQTLALYAALTSLCQEHRWSAVNIKCQYEFSKEYRVVPCVALSLLADEGVTASCEGDIPNTVSMLLLQALSGETVTYGDALSHKENVVTFSPCGFLPLSMGAPGVCVQKFMEHPGFSGVQVCGVLRPEKVTFLRIVEDVGTYHLIYGTGQGLPTSPRSGCMPALDVHLDGSIEDFCSAYAGQHYALAYGDYSTELAAFARLIDFSAICIH